MKTMEMKYLLVLIMISGLLTSCFKKEDEEKCSDTCQYANDGECDDGGYGSAYSLCPCGTDCSDCGERTELECESGSSSSSSGSSSSSSSGSSSSSSGGSSSSSSGGSSSSSGGGSSSSSSGGVSYMPTGTVHLVFNTNYRYSGTTSSKTGQVVAPWDPATSIIGYTNWACPPVGQNIGATNITVTNVVYYRYNLNRCGANPIDNYENTWMPAYDGESVTFYIGP